jgi:transposase InsO family protein
MKLRNPVLRDELRKFYENDWSHREVQDYLHDHYHVNVSVRTLKRWKPYLCDPSWPGPHDPRPPVPIVKVTTDMIARIVGLRQQTGWGRTSLKVVFPYAVSETTYRRIIKANGLSRGSKIEHQRVHWVKWERDHPDTMWQLDATQRDDKTWLLPVIDDCSRYCLGMQRFDTMTTDGVIAYLERLFVTHGKPRELLTDNGEEYGGTSKNSRFDQWCRQQGIIHIRSRIHKPTTTGKVERFHLTFQQEIPYCHGDIELFRYRYNHIRPHMSLNGKRPAGVYFDIQQRIKTPEHKPQQKWG